MNGLVRIRRALAPQHPSKSVKPIWRQTVDGNVIKITMLRLRFFEVQSTGD